MVFFLFINCFLVRNFNITFVTHKSYTFNLVSLLPSCFGVSKLLIRCASYILIADFGFKSSILKWSSLLRQIQDFENSPSCHTLIRLNFYFSSYIFVFICCFNNPSIYLLIIFPSLFLLRRSEIQSWAGLNCSEVPLSESPSFSSLSSVPG